MLFKNRNIKLFSLFAISLVLMSWGYNGHYKINGNASLSFTPEMEQFMAWSAVLAEHASDADARKEVDPDEGPRHYIDIDNYPGFLASGRIPQTYDSVVALYGESFVIDQGVLPWATKISYDSLVNCLSRWDLEKAVLFASDLGHYVGDAHNPLHITRNYNGQYTGNYGIHSRYESGMINAYLNEIDYTGDAISFITDINGYIFNYIYSNYIYVDSIMAADDYAEGVAGNNTSSVYKAALWEKTRNFTIPLFSRASNTLAKLIYSAWVEAGKPDFNSGPGIFDPQVSLNILQLHASPNPFRDHTFVNFTLPETTQVYLKIINESGITMKTLVDSCLSEGIHEFSFKMDGFTPGIYFMSLEAGKYRDVKKAIKISSR
jgi:hypothetical protein